MAFQKATKKQAKLRLALFGVSGGGKTYTALRLATGIVSRTGGRIAFIDTEKRTACKYSDRFDFDVDEVDKPTINNIMLSMKDARKHDVLIIDSLTHPWNELVQEVNQISKAKYGGNSFGGWSEGTPKQEKFIEALQTFPGHIIATMRSKTEWLVQENEKGKKAPVRVGITPKQRDGAEYEFDMLMNLSQEHIGHVMKDRTGKFQDQFIECPDEAFGAALVDWLNEGEEEQVDYSSSEELDEDVINIEAEESIKPKKSKHKTPPIEEDETLGVKKSQLVVEEREDATDEEFVEEFKIRCKKIMDSGEIKLFQKQNKLSVKDPQSIREFMIASDLELSIAKFLEEVSKK